MRLHINIGIAYSRVDEIEAALAAFREAVAVAPADARPPLNLGRRLNSMGELLDIEQHRLMAGVLVAIKSAPPSPQTDQARLAYRHVLEATRLLSSPEEMAGFEEHAYVTKTRVIERAHARPACYLSALPRTPPARSSSPPRDRVRAG